MNRALHRRSEALTAGPYPMWLRGDPVGSLITMASSPDRVYFNLYFAPVEKGAYSPDHCVKRGLLAGPLRDEFPREAGFDCLQPLGDS